MPTSRYESYPLQSEPETKEEIVGDNRITRRLGELALVIEDEEDYLFKTFS